MRTFGAWLLLLIVSAYYVGGYLCFRGIYTVKVEHRMTAHENALAEALRAETGLETNIKILQDAQMNAVAGGYSGVFIFTKEIDGREVRYIVDPDPIQVVDLEYFVGHYSDLNEQGSQAILLARLFSQFVINEVSMAFGGQATGSPAGAFSFSGLRDLCILSVPTPPPWPA